MTAGWIKPTVDQIRARREKTGCSLMDARASLEWENIQRAMPDITEKQDFTRLAHVVQWLMQRQSFGSFL